MFTESNGQHSFIDEVSQKTATVQTVSFIDLKAYRPAVGRTALPVFRIPVETSSYVDAGNFAPNSLAAWKLHPRVLKSL
ncbi:MAG: hypothetical protein IPJ71_19225 [Bdellovibrionales bacterium]|nr:hypothetical protein [Bdellovibrionales bacterium]